MTDPNRPLGARLRDVADELFADILSGEVTVKNPEFQAAVVARCIPLLAAARRDGQLTEREAWCGAINFISHLPIEWAAKWSRLIEWNDERRAAEREAAPWPPEKTP